MASIQDVSKVAITPGQQMISSCSGALITSFMVTPFDVVKIRLQAQRSKFARGSCFIYCNGLMDHLCVCNYCVNGRSRNGGSHPIKHHADYKQKSPHSRSFTNAARGMEYSKQWYGRPGHFNGTMDAFVKIARTEGIPSLWSGLPPTLVMSVPATVVYFTFYEKMKYAFGFKDGATSNTYIPIAAGSVARIGAATLISPLELIRTKMQSELLTYREIGRAIKDSVEHGGVFSLMRGLGPTLLRDVPFSGIYWFVYEYLKSSQLRYSGSNEPRFYQSLVSGATAGSIAATITLPFDVVKTRRQIELGEAIAKHETQVSSTWSIIRRIYVSEGVQGLFAGMTPRLFKVAPSCAIMISSYEYCKHYFRQRNAETAGMDSIPV